MEENFEIAGTLIKFGEITDFHIVQTEYIYRPVYTKEVTPGIIGNIGSKKRYVFQEMRPYLEIIDEKTGRLKNRKKKYICKNQSGRVMPVDLEEIPALIEIYEGIYQEKRPQDLFPLLEEPVAPIIGFVPTLRICTRQGNYLFYGQYVEIADAEEEFQRLKSEMNQYREQLEQPEPPMQSDVPEKPVTKRSGKRSIFGFLRKKEEGKNNVTNAPEETEKDRLQKEIGELLAAHTRGSISREEFVKRSDGKVHLFLRLSESEDKE